jgi:hypothetical protein
MPLGGIKDVKFHEDEVNVSNILPSFRNSSAEPVAAAM